MGNNLKNKMKGHQTCTKVIQNDFANSILNLLLYLTLKFVKAFILSTNTYKEFKI